MKMFLRATVAVIAMTLTACSGSSGGGANLTTAGKMTTGIASSVTTIQGVGGALGTGAFYTPSTLGNGRSTNLTTLSAATKCTTNAEPGDDANNDGVVDNSEKYNTSNANFALQSFYCAMAANTDGPEAVSGAVGLVKTIVCAMERQLGSLPFDGTSTSVNFIRIDTNCTTQADIDEMSGTPGATFFEIPIPATVTSALNPTFTEIPGNTHYSHGIRIASNDGTTIKFVLVAKFDPSVAGDPINSGNFEFATLGTGTIMQGTAMEFTAGKISGGSSSTKHLWYEFRANRFKSSANDALCESDSGSCGWGRHVRLSTDISFSGGDISGIANFSGVISDGSDNVGSGGMSNSTRVLTAKGGLTTGLAGMIWTSNTSGKTITGALSGMTAGTPTCITSAGSPVSTSCGGHPAYQPSGNIDSFVRPANTATWFTDMSTHGGLGFTGDASLADAQYATP